MISVDISNIWGSISLPDLLAEEKNVFDAHLALCGGECKQNPWFSWLSPSEEARRKWVGPVTMAAERIRRDSRILVVVGGGLPAAAAKAAIRLLPTRPGNLRLLFVGEDLSAEKWQKATQALEGTDFSVLVLSPGKSDTMALVALRSLRWLLRSRYGDEAPQRIYMAADPMTPMGRLAEKLGCVTLPMPREPYAACSAISPAALLIMAAAGLNPGPIYSGAAAFCQETDYLSFDNPLWLYAAARKLLADQGCCETVCTTVPSAAAYGSWWQRYLSAMGGKVFVRRASLPEDFLQMGRSLLQSGQFMTVLRMGAMNRHVAVEADFRNLDGLGDLSRTDLDTLEAQTTDTLLEAFGQADVPYITVECEEPPTEESLGHLLMFTEMAAVLCAKLQGDSTEPDAAAVLKQLEQILKQN